MSSHQVKGNVELFESREEEGLSREETLCAARSFPRALTAYGRSLGGGSRPCVARATPTALSWTTTGAQRETHRHPGTARSTTPLHSALCTVCDQIILRNEHIYEKPIAVFKHADLLGKTYDLKVCCRCGVDVSIL